MLKKIVALMLSFLMIVLFVACGAPKNKSVARSIEDIKNSGKLIVATSADYPPYEFLTRDNGIQGLDIEIARIIAEELGVELQIDDMDFKDLLTVLEAGECDMVIAALTPDEERKKSVDFSEIYYLAKQSVVVRKADLDKYRTVEDFTGKTICAQSGSTQEDIAHEQFAGAEVTTLAKMGSLILELQTGRVEAIVMELPVAEMYATINPELAVSTVAIADTVASNAIAVAKGNGGLLEHINKVLATLDEKTVNDMARAAAALSENEL